MRFSPGRLQRRLVPLLTSVFFLASAGRGAIKSDDGHSWQSGSSDLLQKGSVYVYGDQSLDNLISVRLLGAVAKPGIYYVPVSTDLVTLISLAGGTIDQAVISEIALKRVTQGKSETIKLDLAKIIDGAELQGPTLVAGDTILVPRTETFISDNTMRSVTVITGIATIFSAAVIGLVTLRRNP